MFKLILNLNVANILGTKGLFPNCTFVSSLELNPKSQNRLVIKSLFLKKRYQLVKSFIYVRKFSLRCSWRRKSVPIRRLATLFGKRETESGRLYRAQNYHNSFGHKIPLHTACSYSELPLQGQCFGVTKRKYKQKHEFGCSVPVQICAALQVDKLI